MNPWVDLQDSGSGTADPNGGRGRGDDIRSVVGCTPEKGWFRTAQAASSTTLSQAPVHSSTMGSNVTPCWAQTAAVFRWTALTRAKDEAAVQATR